MGDLGYIVKRLHRLSAADLRYVRSVCDQLLRAEERVTRDVDQPERCPTCGRDDEGVWWTSDRSYRTCLDPWHRAADHTEGNDER